MLSTVLLMSCCRNACAFEVTTHGAMTKQAWIGFVVADPAALSRLGLVELNDAFETKGYYDYRPNSGELPFKRYGLKFESDIIISEAINQPPFSIPGWLIRGAIREDDDVSPTDESPKDDTRGDFHRVFSHFQDPANNNRPLTISGIGQLGASAADWALTTGASTPAFSPDGSPQRLNNFNLQSFRESQWIALTGMDKWGAIVAPATSTRNVYWATAFRALGDVLHLNQDMAQPQHTRNDSHAGRFKGIVAGHKSVFERYTDARVRGNLGFSNRDDAADANIAINPQPVNYGSYPVPAFAQYADYWAGSTHAGLADYSNRGFFSVGTLPSNLSNAYALPSRSDSSYTTEQVTITRWSGQAVSGWIPKATLFKGNVDDATGQPPATDVPLHAKSIWEESRQTLTAPVFGPLQTLTKANYDAAIDLLIPRAVAYSAGILKYAFRGRLDITPSEEGIYSLIDHYELSGAGKNATDASGGFKGFKSFKLNLRNATPDIIPSGGGSVAPQIMPGGTLVGVLKFYRNNNYTDDLAGEPANASAYSYSRSTAEEIVVSSRVKDGAGNILTGNIPVTTTTQTFIFEFDQELPINATDVKLQVVYRGALGSEADAVVVETVDISEPAYVTYLNSTDYIQIGNGLYTRDQINDAAAGVMLRSQVRPTTCIDSMTGLLKDTCLQPIPLDFDVKFGSTANSANAHIALPQNKTYHRLAMLIPPGSTGLIDWSQAHAACGYRTTLNIPRRVVQTDYTAEYPDGFTLVSPVLATQGVRSWASLSCILNGDSQPHDDLLTPQQNAAMAVLPLANQKPLQLGSFNFGAP